MRKRFVRSVLAGLAIATAVVWFAEKKRHAAMVAQAAKAHQSVAAIYADGFIFTAVIVAAIVFIVWSIVAAARQSRTPAAPRQSAYSRYREGAGR